MVSGKITTRNTKAAKLTLQQVGEIRRLYAEDGLTQAELARKFGVGVGQVGRIVRGEAWNGKAEYVEPRKTAEESLRAVLSMNLVQEEGKEEGKPGNWYDGLTDEEMRQADKLMGYGVDVWVIREQILKGREGV